jgi:hypothetical protein
MQALDPESLMNKAVCAAGGRCVRDSVGSNPTFNNADYVFPSDNVVGELKSLEKDFLNDPTVHEKMHVLYDRWVDESKDVPIIYGEGLLRTDQIPVECARELIGIFKDRLEGSFLWKANRQIRETKENLNYPDALGLLLLSNEGNLAFDPEMVAYVLFHSLGSKFSSIEHVILFSANLQVVASATTLGGPPFMSILLPNRRQPTDAFLHKLGSGWYEVLGAATGRTFPSFEISKPVPADIAQLRFGRRILRQ